MKIVKNVSLATGLVWRLFASVRLTRQVFQWLKFLCVDFIVCGSCWTLRTFRSCWRNFFITKSRNRTDLVLLLAASSYLSATSRKFVSLVLETLNLFMNESPKIVLFSRTSSFSDHLVIECFMLPMRRILLRKNLKLSPSTRAESENKIRLD